MNLYHLHQDDNNGYDTYDSCVVAAESGEEAVKWHPNGKQVTEKNRKWGWAEDEYVTCRLLGIAVEGTVAGVICASFNAG